MSPYTSKTYIWLPPSKQSTLTFPPLENLFSSHYDKETEDNLPEVARSMSRSQHQLQGAQMQQQTPQTGEQQKRC